MKPAGYNKGLRLVQLLSFCSWTLWDVGCVQL